LIDYDSGEDVRDGEILKYSPRISRISNFIFDILVRLEEKITYGRIVPFGGSLVAVGGKR
jgi:hypothetical protein